MLESISLKHLGQFITAKLARQVEQLGISSQAWHARGTLAEKKMFGAHHASMKPTIKIVSVCGVDGTGKTTLIKILAQKGFLTLRSPQIHESGDFTESTLSRALEELSQLADQEKDLVTKACALFLAMSLQPAAERELIEKHQVSNMTQSSLFRERDPILDLVVYGPLYLKILKSKDRFQPKIHCRANSSLF